jgi:hypothetical protein
MLQSKGIPFAAENGSLFENAALVATLIELGYKKHCQGIE